LYQGPRVDLRRAPARYALEMRPKITGGRTAYGMAAYRMAAYGLCAALGGCQHADWRADSPASVRAGTGVRASMDGGDRVITGIVVALLLAGELRYYARGDDGSLTLLERSAQPDPARAVSEQDCTAPVDPARGNLKCR
jgi:hypothetical protein